MENNGRFFGHLEYMYGFLFFLWPFGNLVLIWYIVSRKIWQPCTSLSLIRLFLRLNEKIFFSADILFNLRTYVHT
jgi:hypothetical protein